MSSISSDEAPPVLATTNEFRSEWPVSRRRAWRVACDEAQSSCSYQPQNFWPGVRVLGWRVVDCFLIEGRRYLACELPTGPEALSDPLSPTECQTARFLALGLANKAIGYELDLSTSRIGMVLGELSAKLGAKNRVELITVLRHLLLVGLDRSTLGPVYELHDGGRHFAFTSAAEPKLDHLDLTAAQLDILRQILVGASNAAIAKQRGTSIRTVANQIGTLLRTLGAASRYELAASVGWGIAAEELETDLSLPKTS